MTHLQIAQCPVLSHVPHVLYCRLLKDMNDVMRSYLLECKGQMPRPSAKKKVTFQTDSSDNVDSGVAMGDSELVSWLESIQLDQASIQRVCPHLGHPIRQWDA